MVLIVLAIVPEVQRSAATGSGELFQPVSSFVEKVPGVSRHGTEQLRLVPHRSRTSDW